MKRIYLFLFAALCIFVAPTTMQANDYLEHFNHYKANGGAENSIKFDIPVWVYGAVNDYYLAPGSCVYATCDGTTTKIFEIYGERRGKNDTDGNEGEGWLKIVEGSIVIHTYAGTDIQVPADNAAHKYSVGRKEDDDHKRISHMEFNWYPPAKYDGKSFKISIHADVQNKRTEGRPSGSPYDWAWSESYEGKSIMQTPELFTPYLYSFNEKGTAGYGAAAIPYATYQEPISYTTSLNSNQTNVTSQAGQLFVATTDQVQRGYYANFELWRDKSNNSKATLRTNTVDIPAYHRPYNIKAAEAHDATESLTGYVNVQWEVKNPQEADLIEGDYFELQRATKKNYSDAQSIAMIPISKDSAIYHYTDDVRELGSSYIDDTTTQTMLFDVPSQDGTGVVATFRATMKGKIPSHGVPLYYRVRRASAGVWGWSNHEFAISTSLYKNTHLAPLASTQQEYVLDSNFNNNRKVHFNIAIDNEQVRMPVLPKDSFDFKFEFAETGLVIPDSLRLEYAYHYLSEHKEPVTITVELPYPDELIDQIREDIGLDVYPSVSLDESKVYFKIQDTMIPLPRVGTTGYKYQAKIHTDLPASMGNFVFVIESNRGTFSYVGMCPLYSATTWVPEKVQFNYSHENGNMFTIIHDEIEMDSIDYPGIVEYVAPKLEEIYAPTFDLELLKDSIYKTKILPLFANQDTISRCIWDRNASLILTKNMTNLGLKQDIIVPSDSIVRQPDGSWLAHIEDVADASCTEYEYSVRIDPSHSLIRLRLPEQANPVAISGARLYTDQAATIGTFAATQGTDKQGVLLQWEPTSGGMTEYILSRREHGSSEPFDTILTTTDVGYRDMETPPDKHYDYQLTISYECNGNHSESSAEVEGWRSPYGSIAGRVALVDGSGNAGITINVTKEIGGHTDTVATTLTAADGSFYIDNILYDADGTDFSVTPSAQYGTFTYNNTSSAIAAVTLYPARAEATGIEFVNTDAFRLTGRVLYRNTTIPVTGAMFRLNGEIASYAGSPVKTQQDGTFSMCVPRAPITLQVYKPGHTFGGDGYLRINNDSLITLDAPLDGVRFWDETTVRLVGRLVGGNDQGNKQLGFGLSKNNLGDDLQMVMELEGDNVSHMIRYPQDPTITERDTTYVHTIAGIQGTDTVGSTAMLITQKHLYIHPDIETGEFAIDLWPVRYKITQLTANGYATLFAKEAGSETIDLTDAVNSHITDYRIDTARGIADTVEYNAIYKHIYHAPITLSVTQRNYGVDCDYYGEEKLPVSSMVESANTLVDVINRDSATKAVHYVFGYPVYRTKTYTYRAWAYEEYFYNNNRDAGKRDRVNMHGGLLSVHNGMHNSVDVATYVLNTSGQADFSLEVDDPEFSASGEAALRTISVTAEIENDYINAEPIHGFITGNRIDEKDLHARDAGISILDILRDPPGANSSAYIEKGATYRHSYEFTFDVKLGVEIDLKFGTNVSSVIGTWAGVGTGAFTGMDYTTSKQTIVPIPIEFKYKGGYEYGYDITTNERISTSSDVGIGSDADVFIGVNNAILYGLARAVRIIDEDTWKLRQTAYQGGTLKLLASGVQEDGNKYYLVIGTEHVLGSSISNSFAYSQDYIINQELPKLTREVRNLLRSGTKDEVQALANATKHVQYWSHPGTPADSLTYPGKYDQILPADHTAIEPDQIEAYNSIIAQWVKFLQMNEKQKVSAKQQTNTSRKIGTWSVSGGVSRSYSEKFTYSTSSSYQPAFGAGAAIPSLSAFAQAGEDVVVSIYNALSAKAASSENTPLGSSEITCTAPGTKFSVVFKPVVDGDLAFKYGVGESHTKTMGFTLSPDAHGYMTTDVYSYVDSAFMAASKEMRDKSKDKNDTLQCGSFVYYLEAGASVCPHEAEERTRFYNPGTLLNNGTLKVEDPRISIDTHERSNVPADKAAIFSIRISNDGQVEGSSGATFSLTQPANTNPNGAKIYIDGMPITSDKTKESNTEFSLKPGQSITKVMEVYRGEVDDYEDLQLCLSSTSCRKNKDYLSFSVHYLPSSSDVAISSPHDKWTMNTFSAQDSLGYYLPVTIEGFDINHRGFDHIEFQYKLSTQSDDDWVNQCSFYANDSLYEAATGNKAKITNGRINTLRFYGERDPMEQHYDLRAVTFCRHGSGFVTKASPVLSGMKDTRPPRVFGHPQPANSVLTVQDDIKLRFNEPIAGNYLDEDNNFYIVGGTNKSGITTSTALSFDGNRDSYATTKVARDLNGHNFSIDVLVKPMVHNKEQILFRHGNDSTAFLFGITEDNRLFAAIHDKRVVSKVLQPITDYNRLVVTCDTLGAVHFFAGTLDVTEGADTLPTYGRSDVLVFGRGLHGNMLEARVWTKELRVDDVALTHMHRLTGYEQELLAYFPMDEGKGSTCTDKANGATLYTYGTGWNMPAGLSVRLNGKQVITLDQDKFARSGKQDYTLMFWFKTTSTDAPLYRAGWIDSTRHGTFIGLEKSKLVFRNNSLLETTTGTYNDNAWHHYTLAVNRAYNTASIYLDGKLLNSFAAAELSGLGGLTLLGGDGFVGHFDEVVMYEQALPKTLVETYDNLSPEGDAMGLMALLAFEEQKENDNGILELVFSPNDQRIFNDADGNVIQKTVPLIIGTKQMPMSAVEALADNSIFAPLKDRGQVSKMNFDWAFNNDELMVNINMADHEINKQTIYITVRDVEDLNGNRMQSPVMWTAYVDKNSLKWSERKISMSYDYHDTDNDHYIDLQIANTSGNRHQFSIASLPAWLTADYSYGSLDPLDEKTIRLTFRNGMSVGTYNDVIYLTDENELSEPLQVELVVSATFPYDEIDRAKYPLIMSICGQVKLIRNGETVYDNDPNDIVYAMYHNECVGMANLNVDNNTGTAEVYLTVYGNDSMIKKAVNYMLWQASTGKVYSLLTNRTVHFHPGDVFGCGNEDPIIFTTGGSELMNIPLKAGWNWVSFNLNLNAATGRINHVLTAAEPWAEGDIIKTPARTGFDTYSARMDAFVGPINAFDFHDTYMIYCHEGNIMRVSGNRLPDDSMQIYLNGDNRWSAMPCLLQQATPVTEALADYYNYATAGDLIKSHDCFAVFSKNGKWVGDLQTIRPGEGYLFRRLGKGGVNVRFYNPTVGKHSSESKRSAALMPDTKWSNPNASANMTMIAMIADPENRFSENMEVYVGDQLAGIATRQDSLLFITIGSDKQGELRFRTTNGVSYISEQPIMYQANSHYGMPASPVILKQGEPERVRKIIEDQHVIIIRNGERFDLTGRKLTK